MEHHPVFAGLRPWAGRVDAGFDADCLGVLTRDAFCSFAARRPNERVVATPLPAFDEEYFEWIDLLEAVDAAGDRFTMVELGAGWGRWLVRAWAALQARRPGVPCRLIGVEAEPAHFAWMTQHARDNGIPADACELIEAAVTARDGHAWFNVGRPADCYGQPLAASAHAKSAAAGLSIVQVRAVSVKTLLGPETVVDLIDLDVQGAELDVLRAAADDLDGKVRRIHVGTHGPAVEAGLRELFSSRAWINGFDYPGASHADTPWGRIRFQDGVQSWRNPRLA